MCGRMTATSTPKAIEEHFKAALAPMVVVNNKNNNDDDTSNDTAGQTTKDEWHPNYNVAPTQRILVVTADSLQRCVGRMRWGLVPFFAKDVSIGNRMINARAETITEKPAFRNALKHKRCLIPADGFYEWQRTSANKKQPWFIHSIEANQPLAFAGLWETWRDPNTSKDDDSEVLQTCSIVTTYANKDMSDIHDRMPLILEEDDWDSWLLTESNSVADIEPLLKSPEPGRLHKYKVGDQVNNVRNNNAELLNPIS